MYCQYLSHKLTYPKALTAQGSQRKAIATWCNSVRTSDLSAWGASLTLRRKGTPAASMQEQVPPEIREARRDELISLQQRIGQEFAESMTGREVCWMHLQAPCCLSFS